MSGNLALTVIAFEQAKERLDQLGKENSLFYTRPTDDRKASPVHKYTLRGVATTTSTFYVLARTKPETDDNLIDLEVDEWQWWKLEYVSTDVKPVVTTTVSEEDVLKAARIESRNVLLVYADEFAMNYESTALPSQLANFVRADNLSFQAELNDFLQSTRESPGKRKALSDDQDDLVTEHPRSPPFNRDHFSEDALDPNPPDYDDTSPSPSPRQSFRTLRPKLGEEGSSDNTIPISLRTSDYSMNHPHMSFDRDEMSQGDQEMQEKGGGASLLRSRTDIKDGYRLGDYSPEISMEDEEDDEALQDGRSEHVDSLQGRGIRGDTW